MAVFVHDFHSVLLQDLARQGRVPFSCVRLLSQLSLTFSFSWGLVSSLIVSEPGPQWVSQCDTFWLFRGDVLTVKSRRACSGNLVP